MAEDSNCPPPPTTLTDDSREFAAQIINDIIDSVVDYAFLQQQWIKVITNNYGNEFFQRSPRPLLPMLLQTQIRVEEVKDSRGDPERKTYQMKGIRQRVPNQCGYFAVFNSIHVRFLPVTCSLIESKSISSHY